MSEYGHERLLERGWARWKGAVVSPEVCEELVAGVRRLIALSHEERELWRFDLQALQRKRWFKRNGLPYPMKPDEDDGLYYRGNDRDPERAKDPKWVFHFRPHLPELLRARGVPIGPHEDFLNLCAVVHRMCLLRSRTIIGDACAHAEECDAGLVNPEWSVLRIIVYDLLQEGAEIGGVHYDRNFFTMHLAESSPGLYFGDRLVETREGELLGFFGLKASEVFPGATPVEHRIVQGRTAGSQRSSIVFFVNTEAVVLPVDPRKGPKEYVPLPLDVYIKLVRAGLAH